MIQTKVLVTELTEIPTEWVFEHYLKLPEKLMGQNLMILSPFNPKDKRPSLSIFVGSKGNNVYLFRDFSTGKSGDNVSLIKSLFNYTTRGEAAHRIIEDYNKWLLTNKEDMSLREFKVQQRYKVTAHQTRGWNTLDQKFWTKFHIGSKLLSKYHVVPLESYEMSKEEDGDTKTLIIKGRSCIYGYFRADVNYDIVSLMAEVEVNYTMSSKFYKKFSLLDIYKSIVLVSIRGFCTPKGLKMLEEHIEKNTKI